MHNEVHRAELPEEQVPRVYSADLNYLIGKLLTYVDATFSVTEQRDAQKSIVKDTLWTWYVSIEDRERRVKEMEKETITNK